MFIGHYAAGFLSKKVSNTLPLPMIFIAVQFLDLIWPIFVLLGIETVRIEAGITKLVPLDFTHYPYSHSLLMTVVWGLVFGTVYYLVTKNREHALILGGLVISHWVLDLVVHRPDLPITPFSDFKVGLGLWNYPVMEIALEFGLFLTGIYIYSTTSKPHKKLAFWSMIIFLMIFQVLNFVGPLPPSINAVAWGTNMLWLFVLWAWWIERGKSTTETQTLE